MNRLMPVVILALTAASTPTFAGQRVEGANETRWQAAFVARVRVLEEKHGIRFDPGWNPTLVFGIPDDIPPYRRNWFGAQYVPETQSFTVSPALERETDPSLIDHELGHALADQISRRAGNGMWPDIESFAGLEWEDKMGINIISEGIGRYFEFQGTALAPKEDSEGYEWLPEGQGDLLWQMRDRAFLYNGGRWLVAPLIKQYGERGIVYLVTHRLRFKDYSTRTAGREYQRLALEELAKNQ